MLTKLFVPLFLTACGSDDTVKVKEPHVHKRSPNELDYQRDQIKPTPTPQQKQLPDHYSCKCRGVEQVCTPEQVKNPKLGCYIIY